MTTKSTEELLRELEESRKQVNEYRQKYEESEKENRALQKEVERLTELSQLYKERISKLTGERYSPKSEKYIPPVIRQHVIPGYFDEAEVTADPDAPEVSPEEFETITYTRRKSKGKREADLSKLARRKEVFGFNEEECICPKCKGRHMSKIGESYVRSEIEYMPAQMNVVDIYAESLECNNCKDHGEKDSIIKAKTPKPLISNSGLASSSLVSAVMYNKYALGLPLARQEQDFTNLGYPVTRQNMANWIIFCADRYLRRVYDHMHQILIKGNGMYIDETRVQVHREPGRANDTDSFMWVYRSGDYEKDQVVLYEYTPTRGSEHPKRFLSGFSGYVQVDGYEVYHGIEGITCAGCWFHLRRKFVEADKSGNKAVPYYSLAAQGLSFIKRLNDIEIRCKDFTPQERKEVRIKESAPIINDFFSWVSKVTSEVLPQSLIGKALAYANKQKPYLLTYLTDGRINFSSNAVERSIRPFASHRNAWLFCDSPRGAEASAICYSIVETAKLNALKPNEYLKFLLLELSQLSSEDSIVDFLPWAPSVPEHYRLPDVPAPNN